MLSFQIDQTSDVPVWAQLSRRIAHLIETGELAPGDQLPTVRGLASEISVNYNTVNKAYLSLASDGYIESVRGRDDSAGGPGRVGQGRGARAAY